MADQPRPEEPSAFAAGAVTRAGRTGDLNVSSGPGDGTWPDVIQQGSDRDPARTRRQLLWFGGSAALVVVVGLVVVLTMVLNGRLGGGEGPFRGAQEAPPDVRPTLARLCPPPTAAPVVPEEPLPDLPPGPRTVDPDAGISYRSYGAPWERWPTVWVGGTLNVPYRVGQHFVTERYANGDYHASILSAAVPAAVNDSTLIDLECTGKQVAADVRAEYYPQPNRPEMIREERTVLGGRPAWVNTFRLYFTEEGLEAKSELVAVALIDVGRPTAAILYVSIPDTHREWDRAVEEVLASVRPT